MQGSRVQFRHRNLVEKDMEYKTLMVHLELGRSNEKLLTLTGELAQRLKAHVIGIASCQPVQLAYNETYIAGDILEEDRKAIEKQMKEAERQLHSTLDGKATGLEWRSTVTFGPLADYMVQQTRAADLVITGPDIGRSVFDHTRQVGIARLILEAGRPVLIVPNGRSELNLNRVIVGWKNTRECRRAISDALPLLELANHVSIIEIVPDEEISRAKHHLGDIAIWLARHGVMANTEAVASTGQDADCLSELAHERQADLLVAGAYGHSRLREWVLGGVTRDFLINPDRCVLLSH
jgi:nucleotide-binding universal stress UspA family protein